MRSCRTSLHIVCVTIRHQPRDHRQRRNAAMSTPRRTFLSLLGLGALSASLPEMLSAETARGLKPVNDKWNLSWTKRVNGKCRAVFDVQALIDDPVARATMWRSQYAQVFGIDESKLS